MKNYKSGLLCFFAVLCFSACKKTTTIDPTGTDPGSTNPGNTDPGTTVADKIAGTYYGDGTFLPGHIMVGTSLGCFLPDNSWRNNLKTGKAHVYITKLTSNTVKIVFSGGPFSQITYPSVTVNDYGTGVIFNDGYYESGSLTFSGNDANSAIYGHDCDIYLPYLFGVSTIGGNGTIAFETIEHVDFDGTKQ
ncbi:hypothetical protein [Ferruginibacter albus]|uniref:hypothetical protein n=1 Tax=Ferruginibacter albus TaxID=2875540 RepID=UPI001CC6D865|nr:hypothetical protein [Ferruginibacter albus]UAY53442.1 hypothetical protein K9M53_07150 [Ferruginibacter albus]